MASPKEGLKPNPKGLGRKGARNGYATWFSKKLMIIQATDADESAQPKGPPSKRLSGTA